jgi:Zn-dependent peptidase ImmA (M78 family)
MTGPTPTRFHNFAELAEILGVTTTHHHRGLPGFYDHPTRTISTRKKMSVGQYRSTIAHELGHAHYHDHPTGNPHYDQRQERRADKYALPLLFTDDQFDDAYAWCGPCVPALAEELECSQHHIRLYLTLKKRDTP